MVQNYVWIHKCVSIVYPFQMAKKESAIRIRVDEELHKNFLAACRRRDRPASQVLREFMRAYVEQDRHYAQRNLFEERSLGNQ